VKMVDLLGVCHDVLPLCRCDFWGLSFSWVCVSCDLLGVGDCVVICCVCVIDDLLGVCHDVLHLCYYGVTTISKLLTNIGLFCRT